MLNGSNGQRLEHIHRVICPTILTEPNANEAHLHVRAAQVSRAAWNARPFIGDSLNCGLYVRPIQGDITQFLSSGSST